MTTLCCPPNLLCAFIFVFLLVYYLESIGGTYTISVVQSLEKQFQIPSKMSGSLISASDLGYVPTVVVLAYLGSRGNRARWIGGGCILVAVANFIMSTPNFLFRRKPFLFNETAVDVLTKAPEHLLRDDVTPEELLSLPFIKKKMPEFVRTTLLNKVHGREAPNPLGAMFGSFFDYEYEYEDVVHPDGSPERVGNVRPNETEGGGSAEQRSRARRDDSIMEKNEMQWNPEMVPPHIIGVKKPPKVKALQKFEAEAKKMITEIMIGSRPAQDFFDFIKRRLREGVPKDAKQGMIRASTAPMGFCNPVVNKLKQYVKDERCKEQQTNLAAYSIVFSALILLGIGHSMPWSLGLPLIDDNIKRTSLPSYFAFMFFIKILGPISGFFVGALCNKLYYTLDQPAGLTPVDPRWIGAWWLGYLLVGSVLVVPALALFCFPAGAVQKGIEQRRQQQEQQQREQDGAPHDVEDKAAAGAFNGGAGGNRTPAEEKKRHVALIDTHMHKPKEGGLWNELKTFGHAIKTVLARPVYTFCLIGRIFDAFAFKGYYSFLPKYLDNHFGIPQYKANVYLGSFGIVGFALGMLGGSVVMRIFKLEGRRAAGYVAVCTALAATLALLKIGLGCQSVVNSLGPKLEAGVSFTTSCNEHCNCGPVSLMPVCSQTGAIYYSPCHAGCENMTMVSVSDIRFTDCQCVDAGEEVRREWCKDDCGPMIVAFFALATASGLASGFGVVPGILIVLRSVPPEWRSISIGFSGFVVSIGTLMSPPFYGWVIDSACVLWEETCPGSDTAGSCLVYEASTLRVRLHVVYSVLRACGCLLDLAVLYHAKGLLLVSGGDGDGDGEDRADAENAAQFIGNPDMLHSNEDVSKKMSM